jgi:hypothetical protein
VIAWDGSYFLGDTILFPLGLVERDASLELVYPVNLVIWGALLRGQLSSFKSSTPAATDCRCV